MGTGVGEAMLIGAAVGATAGGAGAAIQGGDPLQGALTGGAMGAVGGGLGAAAGATGGTLAGGTSGTAAGAGGGATAGASTGATTGSVFGGTAGTAGGATSLGTSIGGVSGGSGALGSAGFGATGGATGGAAGGASGGAAGGGAGGFGIGQGANYVNFANTAGTSTYGGLGGAGAGTTAAGGYGIAAPTTSASLSGAGAGTTAGTTGGTTAGTTGAEKNIFGYKPTDAGYLSNTQLGMTAGTAGLAGAMQAERGQYGQPDESYDGPLSKLKYDPNKFKASNPQYAPTSVYRPTYAAEGGIMQAYQSGGPVERMTQMNTAMNPQGGLYPQGMIDKTQYATPTQRPTSLEVVESEPSYEARVNPTTGTLMAKGGIARYDMGGIAGAASGLPNAGTSGGAGGQMPQPQGLELLLKKKRGMLTPEQTQSAQMQGLTPSAYQDIYGKAEQMARGGISSLGSYSDGGRMLKGPGDGMSDNIPATIAGKQPARLADGEFVVPADVVSHLGNGSTDAGAKQLYAMMNRVRKARTGNPKQGKQIKPAKYLAA